MIVLSLCMPFPPPPEVPPVTSVTAWPVSSSAITVNWAYSEPECGTVDRFMLTYSRDGGTQMMLTISDVTKRSMGIADLDNKQGTYTIRMTAVYQSTPSTASDPVVVDFEGKGSTCTACGVECTSCVSRDHYGMVGILKSCSMMGTFHQSQHWHFIIHHVSHIDFMSWDGTVNE